MASHIQKKQKQSNQNTDAVTIVANCTALAPCKIITKLLLSTQGEKCQFFLVLSQQEMILNTFMFMRMICFLSFVKKTFKLTVRKKHSNQCSTQFFPEYHMLTSGFTRRKTSFLKVEPVGIYVSEWRHAPHLADDVGYPLGQSRAGLLYLEAPGQ